MATFIQEIPPEAFVGIVAELQRKPIQINNYRIKSGKGRSQGFGIIRRMSYRPWIGRTTWERIGLYKLIVDFAEQYNIFGWDGVQVNQNYQTAPHKDPTNVGESYIVGFGDYTGGELLIGDSPHDIHHKGYRFNGAELLHSTAPFEGNRYTMVFFKISIPPQFGVYTVKSEVLEEDGQLVLRIVDSYDESVLVLDKKGHIIRTEKVGKPMVWKGYLTSRQGKNLDLDGVS